MQNVIQNIEGLLKSKGFKIKKWISSGSEKSSSDDQKATQLMTSSDEYGDDEKVLELHWEGGSDSLTYTFGAERWRTKTK